MAGVGARVQEMEIHRVCVTTSPATATCLHKQKTSAELAGYLADYAYCYQELSWNVKTAGCE
jgi:hypothetical protein